MGKKITLFLINNLPKGLRSIRIDQWIGKAICSPRGSIKKIDHSEIKNSACIYFLIDTNGENDLLNIYVGETDSFKNRVNNHNYKKDWWQEIIVFYSLDQSLTKTGAKYLEEMCIEKLINAGKCNLTNGNHGSKTNVPLEDKSGLKEFFINMTTTLPLLGYDIFEQSSIGQKKKSSFENLFCRKKGVKANGILLEDGKILVQKGSTAIIKNAPSFNKHNYKHLKDKLLKIGKLKKGDKYLIFTDDHEFNSPSAAAAIILARSASGPNEWKNKKGKKLKDILNE